MVMMMMIIQHFPNSRVKNALHPSLLVIPHHYLDGWVDEGKNTLGAVAQNTEGTHFWNGLPTPVAGPPGQVISL